MLIITFKKEFLPESLKPEKLEKTVVAKSEVKKDGKVKKKGKPDDEEFAEPVIGKRKRKLENNDEQ